MGNLYNQKHYSLLYKRATGRHLHVKIDLLNEKDVKVDSFEGIVTSGNVDLNSDSTYRRTGKLSMISNKDLLPKPNNKIWFDKRIKIYIGLEDFEGQVYWYDMGKFAMDKVSAKSGKNDKTIDANCLDYMSFLDGVLGGHLSHETKLKAESGVKINEAILATVKHLPKIMIDRFEVDGLDVTIPYDLNFSPNGTVFDMLKQLIELYMSQEMYFDVDGNFRVQRIKDRKFDPIIWDFTEDDMDLSIDYVNEIDMSNIKNSIYVWGNVNKDNGIQTSWVYRNRWERINYSELNNLSDKQKGDICYIRDNSKSYSWSGTKWTLLDFDVIPMFNIENIGEKIWAFSDDKIHTEQQSRLRCEYELTNHSNFAETISISCLPIYLLDCNKKIRIKDEETGIDGDYLVTNISVPLGIDGVMSIKCRKIYY